MSSKQKTVDRQHKCNWANHVESDFNWADIKKITLWMPWARPCWIFFTGDCFQRILFGFKLFLGVRNSVDRLRGFYISQRLNCTKYFLTKQRHSSFLPLITANFAVVWNLARRSGSSFAVSSAIYHVMKINLYCSWKFPKLIEYSSAVSMDRNNLSWDISLILFKIAIYKMKWKMTFGWKRKM